MERRGAARRRRTLAGGLCAGPRDRRAQRLVWTGGNCGARKARLRRAPFKGDVALGRRCGEYRRRGAQAPSARHVDDRDDHQRDFWERAPRQNRAGDRGHHDKARGPRRRRSRRGRALRHGPAPRALHGRGARRGERAPGRGARGAGAASGVREGDGRAGDGGAHDARGRY